MGEVPRIGTVFILLSKKNAKRNVGGTDEGQCLSCHTFCELLMETTSIIYHTEDSASCSLRKSFILKV